MELVQRIYWIDENTAWEENNVSMYLRYGRRGGSDAAAGVERAEPNAVGERHGASGRSGVDQDSDGQRPPSPLDPQTHVVQLLICLLYYKHEFRPLCLTLMSKAIYSTPSLFFVRS